MPERARESAYLATTSIVQIRDPLEWLSLGELFQLCDMQSIGNLGLDPAIWRNFSAQVVPIRNRTAHMRNLHQGNPQLTGSVLSGPQLLRR